MAAQLPVNPSLIVIGAGVSSALHIVKLPPAISILQSQLGVSLVQAGFLLSTVQVAGMCLGLLVGLSADRWGLRRCILVGLFLMALSSVLGPTASSFAWLLALRAMEGLGLLLVVMPAPGLIRRNVSPRDLSTRMGWWGAYMPIGSALGLLLGPWVLGFASWQLWWVALGALSLLAAIAVWFLVPADGDWIAAGFSASDAGWMPRLMQTLRSRGPWLAALSFMVYSAQWVSLIGFLPIVYAQTGINPKTAGLLTALVAAVNMIGNIASGRLLQHGWPARRCLQTGFVVMGACTLLAYAQVDGQQLAPFGVRVLALLLFSAAGGLIPGSLFASVAELSPDNSAVSTTVGFMQQLSCLGQFAGPPIVAAVATLMGGWQWTWLITTALCAAGWLLAIGVQRALGKC